MVSSLILWSCSGGDAVVWKPPGEQPIMTAPVHAKGRRQFMWTDNGQLLVCGTSDGTILSMLPSGSTVHRSSCGEEIRGYALCRRAGKVLAVGVSGSLHVLSVAGKSSAHSKYQCSITDPCGVSVNVSESHAVVSGHDGRLALWNLATVAEVDILQPSRTEAGVNDAVFSPFKKNLLAVAYDSGSVVLWDIVKRTRLVTLPAHRAPATGVAFSVVNELLMCTVGLDKRLQFFDVDSHKLVKSVQSEAPLHSVAFAGDGFTVATGTSQGRVLVYDLRTVTSTSGPSSALSGHQPDAVSCVSFQPETSKMSVSSTPIRRPAESASMSSVKPPLSSSTSARIPPTAPKFTPGTTSEGMRAAPRRPITSSGIKQDVPPATSTTEMPSTLDVFSPVAAAPTGNASFTSEKLQAGPSFTPQSALFKQGLPSASATGGTGMKLAGQQPYTVDGLDAFSPLEARRQSYSQAEITSTVTAPNSNAGRPPASAKPSSGMRAVSNSNTLPSSLSPPPSRPVTAAPKVQPISGTESSSAPSRAKDDVQQQRPKASSSGLDTASSTRTFNEATSQRQAKAPSGPWSEASLGTSAPTSKASAEGRPSTSHMSALSANVSVQEEESSGGPVKSLQLALVKGVVTEAVEAVENRLTAQLRDLHIETLRQGELQLARMEALLDKYAGRMAALQEEVLLLRQENDALKYQH